MAVNQQLESQARARAGGGCPDRSIQVWSGRSGSLSESAGPAATDKHPSGLNLRH